MQTISLFRCSGNADTTFGVLIDDATGTPICNLIENAWKNNTPYQSCVPTGSYICRKIASSKVKDYNNGLSYRLDMEGMNKLYSANRSEIDFHLGNTHVDTEGCLLPVTSFARMWVRSLHDWAQGGAYSADAFIKLTNHLDGAEEFQLIIRSRVQNHA